MVVQYTKGYFLADDPEYYDDKEYCHTVTIDNETIKIVIFDTLSLFLFDYHSDWVKNGNGFILFFAINDQQSFDYTKYAYREIMRIKDHAQVPIILCGCKCDQDNEREVSHQEEEELAREWGVPFFETSALENINVRDTFETLIRLILKKQKTPDPKEDQKVQRRIEICGIF
ncbi:small GTP-binding protein [Histomonas meleagridis]|uniref:small GTP-binding protein n=1 Tax=Histomonas meleagridis TaxID=135588 RepID=UPI0035598602|nr:small GTP-binding protein [Histomonas meleagridis]KAH0806644.1 small GTP-binding protein [Histomonas meleagridis]